MLPRPVLVTLSVTYHRNDFPSILQCFVWQCDDHDPGFPRVGRFLEHWRRERLAVIASIEAAAHDGGGEWRRIDREWQ